MKNDALSNAKQYNKSSSSSCNASIFLESGSNLVFGDKFT